MILRVTQENICSGIIQLDTHHFWHNFSWNWTEVSVTVKNSPGPS